MHTSRMRTIRRTIAGVPGVPALWGHVRRAQYQLTLQLAPRKNQLYTQFCRAPTQLDALEGPIYTALAPHLDEQTLRILVFGCSSGAEPYSISWMLQRRLPNLRFRIDCYDIDPAMVDVARAARYSRDEVLKNKLLPADFVDTALDPVADGFVVKAGITAPVQFHVGDVLNAHLIARLLPADVVVAQNFLFHLARPDAARALVHLIGLLKPTAALLVDGADLDIRSRVTAAAGLHPLDFEMERIHAEARVERGDAWPDIYWGLEPFDRHRADRVRRYATMFLQAPCGADGGPACSDGGHQA